MRIAINGSDGTVTCDERGHNLERPHPDDAYCYLGIIEFNIREYCRFYRVSPDSISAIDILDVGYWYEDVDAGQRRYEPPVREHRQLIAKGARSIVLNESVSKFFKSNI